MTRMKRVIICLIAMALPILANGQGAASLLIPTDSRSLSMGGVFIQPEAATMDAGASYGIWAPGTAANNVVAADVFFRIGDKLALTFEGKDFIDKPYVISGDQGSSRGTFTPNELILSLGAYYYITDALSAGIKLKSVNSDIAETAKGSAFCGDVEVTYGGSNWSATLAGRNIGTKINYSGAAYSLPAYVAAGGQWSPIANLKVAAEADYLFSGAVMAGAGAEYCIADIAFVRAGYHYGDAAKALPSFASLGLGAKYAGISLDAGMILLSETIGNSFLIRLGYAF